MVEWKTIEYKGEEIELSMQSSGTALTVRMKNKSYRSMGVLCDDPFAEKPYYHIRPGSPILMGYPEIKEFHMHFYSLMEAIESVCAILLEAPSQAEYENKKERSKEMLREAWDSINVESEFRPREYMR